MINVTLGEVKTQEKPFPKFMTLKNTEGLFLFKSSTEATCIKVPNPSGNWCIGDYSVDMDITAFEDFEGSFTAKNA